MTIIHNNTELSNNQQAMWINKLKNLKKLLLDLIFPCHCLGCGREGVFLCPNCLVSIPLLSQQICPSCRQSSPSGSRHPSCSGSLDGIIIASSYRHPLLSQAIKQFKYKGIFSLGKDLAQLLIACLERAPQQVAYFTDHRFILVPLPLTRRKLVRRGYNQTAILGREVCSHFSWPWQTDLLTKVRATPSQTRLTAEQRIENVRHSFRATQARNKNILIVDDIFTTGATLQEAARCLKEQGAKKVWGLVLAQG